MTRQTKQVEAEQERSASPDTAIILYQKLIALSRNDFLYVLKKLDGDGKIDIYTGHLKQFLLDNNDQLAALKSRERQREEEVAAKHAELDAYRQKLDIIYMTKNAELDELAKSLEDKKAADEAEAKTKEAELGKQVQYLSTWESGLGERDWKAKNRQDEIKAGEEKLKSKEEEYENNLKDLVTAQENLEKELGQLAAEKEKNASREAELTAKYSEFDRQEKRFEEAKLKYEELVALLSTDRQEFDKYKQKAKEQLTEKERYLRDREIKYENNMEQLKADQAGVKTDRDRLSAEEKRITEQVAGLAKLQAEYDSNVDKLRADGSRLAAERDQFKLCQKEFEAEKKEVNRRMEEVGAMSTAVKKSQADFEKWKRELRIRGEELKGEKCELDAYKDRLAEEQARLDELKAGYSRLDSELTARAGQLADNEQVYALRQTELERERQEFDVIKKKIQEADEDIRSRYLELKKVTESRDTEYKKRKAQFGAECDEWRAECDEWRARTETDMEKRIQDKHLAELEAGRVELLNLRKKLAAESEAKNKYLTEENIELRQRLADEESKYKELCEMADDQGSSEIIEKQRLELVKLRGELSRSIPVDKLPGYITDHPGIVVDLGAVETEQGKRLAETEKKLKIAQRFATPTLDNYIKDVDGVAKAGKTQEALQKYENIARAFQAIGLPDRADEIKAKVRALRPADETDEIERLVKDLEEEVATRKKKPPQQ